MVDPLFQVHLLNDEGKEKANQLAQTFNECLQKVAEIIGPTVSREQALVRTHMELASFYSKKAMAQNPAHQQG